MFYSYSQSNGANPNPSIDSVIQKCQQRRYTYQDIQLTRNSSAAVWLYGVPYSEHSSFFELSCFALSLDWDKIIATVNVGSEKSRSKMKKWFEKWAAEKRRVGMTTLKERQPDSW
jgi:DNA cross-link repair 1A protein